ncbi:MAG: alpha/beta hydrolase [Gammaproteobacteria bacterium]|nr:MAG: alpha/beta hydrolase [Gammaproteobacteria bacterium]
MYHPFGYRNTGTLKKVVAILLTLFMSTGCIPKKTTLKPMADNLSPPAVLADSSKGSFWKNQVKYPLPVQYFSVKDARDQIWEIAVMDSYLGFPVDEDTPTLVLIHGRGANSGYFYQLMRYAMEADIRVVAVDLPGYGKSLPGNLGNQIPRTMDDSRKLVFDVLVQQMNIKKAAYLGHSMGGQWVLGYALNYPNAVEKLILESSYGLEEYSTTVPINESEQLAIFNPIMRYDYSKWQSIWSRLGYFDQEFAKSAEDIRVFYHFQKLDPETGSITRSPVGYFKNQSIDSIFLTRVRTQMIWSTADEYERYIRNSIWDIYGQGIELRREDPDSLVKNLEHIRVPVLMAFGEADPFLPTTLFSNNRNIRHDIVKPAFIRLASSGYLPRVVFYKRSGHIPHADQAKKFAADVIQFIGNGEVVSKQEDPLAY